MKKPEKISEKSAFAQAIERAVADYDRSRNGGRWDKAEMEEIARSSAIAEGLSYDGYQVDPCIVTAILSVADTRLHQAYRASVIETAWKAYSKYA